MDVDFVLVPGVVASVVGAFYYVRIVRIVYFDDPLDGFEQPIGKSLTAVLTVTAIITAVFFIGLAPVLDVAEAAALSLLKN